MERIQKIIAHSGFASRRKAEELIKTKKVKLNGKTVSLGDKANWNDKIEINGKLINQKEEHVYYVLNKPTRTITSTNDERGRETVLDLIDESKRIYPVGRLDWDTTGVLLLTNDGSLAHKLTHPSFEIKRVYRARISRSLTDKELLYLNGDEVIVNDKISKQKVTKIANKSYLIVLSVGTYHHVKILFENVEAKVLQLTRVEYAGITVEGLSRGGYRKLKTKEIKWLKNLTSKN